LADLGVVLTDEKIRNLTARLDTVFKEAYETAVENNQKAIDKLANLKNELNDPTGKYSNLTDIQREAKLKYFANEVIRTDQMAKNIADEIAAAGKTAGTLIQAEMPGIWGLNYDFSNYSIQKQLGYEINFAQYDRNQILAILNEDRGPFTKAAITNLGQNTKVVHALQNELLKGTVNGESQAQLIKRIKNVTNQKTYEAKRIVQTERTRVQTQGRMASIKEAEALGIKMDKQWMSRLIRTRNSHLSVHGEIKPSGENFGNGLEYPGDPSGPPEEVINCRNY